MTSMIESVIASSTTTSQSPFCSQEVTGVIKTKTSFMATNQKPVSKISINIQASSTRTVVQPQPHPLQPRDTTSTAQQQPDSLPSHSQQPQHQHDAIQSQPDSVLSQQDPQLPESESAPTVRTKTVLFKLDEPKQAVSQNTPFWLISLL